MLQCRDEALLRGRYLHSTHTWLLYLSNILLAEMTATEFAFKPICRTPERLGISPSRALCKQLFGPIDHSQLQSDLKRELSKLSQETSSRWNYDFVKDHPLEGRYLWSRVKCKEPTSEALASSNCSRIEESNVLARDAVTNMQVSSMKMPLTASKLSTKDKPLLCKKRPSTGKITEFLRKKKKNSSETTKPLQRRSERRRRRGKVQSCLKSFLRTETTNSSSQV